jgi:hypothetical protein
MVGRAECEVRVREGGGVRITDLWMAKFVTDEVKIAFAAQSVRDESEMY